MKNIRNFAIIAHIDHGKSTLSDKLLTFTGTIPDRKMKDRFLDNLDLEREKGVTIKMQTVSMNYQHLGENYILNLIDTPGHVDFGYEVSRALAACEGAILLIDASQGIQAQTLSNALKALDQGLTIIPVVNKIDLSMADVDRAISQFVDILGFFPEEVIKVSAKTGQGIEQLLTTIIETVPAPTTFEDTTTKALVFDSVYSSHKGVISMIKVVTGEIKAGEDIIFMQTGHSGRPIDIGVISDGFISKDSLSAGEVGFIATGFKDIAHCPVGSTVTSKNNKATESLEGYAKSKPMVYASLFPVDNDEYDDFKDALEKLTLNDSSLVYTHENSKALGFGFRIGFLGAFHAAIIKERLEREFELSLIITMPTVEYRILTPSGYMMISSPADLPEFVEKGCIEEPWMKVTLLCTSEYIQTLTPLIQSFRGQVIAIETLSSTQIRVISHLPLAEIISNFHDTVKSATSGYASYDYEFLEFRSSDVVALDILVNHEVVTPFSRLIVRQNAVRVGRVIVEKLRETLPRQQFSLPIQAAIGSNILARETLPAFRKDVTAKLYGGDRTRKDKLLKKQKAGKKRLAQFGKVDIPKETFFEVLKAQ